MLGRCGWRVAVLEYWSPGKTRNYRLLNSITPLLHQFLSWNLKERMTAIGLLMIYFRGLRYAD
jgi:hypothetical protein